MITRTFTVGKAMRDAVSARDSRPAMADALGFPSHKIFLASIAIAVKELGFGEGINKVCDIVRPVVSALADEVLGMTKSVSKG